MNRLIARIMDLRWLPLESPATAVTEDVTLDQLLARVRHTPGEAADLVTWWEPGGWRPPGLATIGTNTQTYTAGKANFDTPNHNYDTSDFDQLVSAIGHGQLPASALPAVSFLKAPGYQDGHAGYSNPIDEQNFITQKINALEQTPDWANTAVVINYDDSDGWYDHVYSGVHNPSTSVADQLTGPGMCGTGTPLAGQNPTTPAADDAGTAARFLDPRTGQIATTPTPALPESPWTIALGASALAIGTGAYLVTKRRRRAAHS